MRKKSRSKLLLARESILRLESRKLEDAAGGLQTLHQVCPTRPVTCMTCITCNC